MGTSEGQCESIIFCLCSAESPEGVGSCTRFSLLVPLWCTIPCTSTKAISLVEDENNIGQGGGAVASTATNPM